ncbi:shikimate 5-dehydrogenase [Moorella thermoacetica Y72]|uniref:Shikimate 5-dehydrogenase n=1 Tax=Moorella thermoacetica Y72 TaxID=1325331 RepID=A0A0S6UCU7_NEOTH|nr:shikimate 5-dehydrogenase [Moorella thermoacetica Y72]
MPGPGRLAFYYIGCLGTTRSFHDVKLDLLSLSQGFETLFLDGGEVDEHVLAVFPFNKAVPLLRVKPFHLTLHLVKIPPKIFSLGAGSTSKCTYFSMVKDGCQICFW